MQSDMPGNPFFGFEEKIKFYKKVCVGVDKKRGKEYIGQTRRGRLESLKEG